MAEGNRPAVDVDLVRVDVAVFHDLERHCGKRLVDLDQIDVVDRHAGFFQHPSGSRHRRRQHDDRLSPGRCSGHNPGPRLHAVAAGVFGRGQQQRPRPIDDAGRVPGVVDVLDVVKLGVARQGFLVEAQRIALLDVFTEFGERRRQAGQPLQGRARARILVVFEHDLALGISHRNQALGKAVLCVSPGVALLARHGKPVTVLTAETLKGGDQVARDALLDQRMEPAQLPIMPVDTAPVGVHRHAGHGFHPAGNDQVLLAGLDAHGRKVDRLLTRAAETVNRHAGGIVGPLRSQHRHAGDAHGLVAVGGDTPDQHVFDIQRVELVAVLDGIQRLRHQFLGMNLGQRPVFFTPSARGPNCVNNPGFAHGILPMFLA